MCVRRGDSRIAPTKYKHPYEKERKPGFFCLERITWAKRWCCASSFPANAMHWHGFEVDRNAIQNTKKGRVLLVLFLCFAHSTKMQLVKSRQSRVWNPQLVCGMESRQSLVWNHHGVMYVINPKEKYTLTRDAIRLRRLHTHLRWDYMPILRIG